MNQSEFVHGVLVTAHHSSALPTAMWPGGSFCRARSRDIQKGPMFGWDVSEKNPTALPFKKSQVCGCVHIYLYELIYVCL